MQPSLSPRPILKRSSSSYPPPAYAPRRHPPLAHAAVHFPPSPTLTRTFTVHSPMTYDRSPIVVAPNSCALPERGGRTYTLDDPASQSALESIQSPRRNLNDHRHPRALIRAHSYGADPSTAMMPQATPPYPLPPLIADCSSSSSSSSCSESEESDGLYSPPLAFLSPQRTSIHGLAIPIPTGGKPSSYNSMAMAMDAGRPCSPALSFLPHPPSPEDEHSIRQQRRRRRPSPNRSSPPSTAIDDAFCYGSPKSITSRSRGVKVHSTSSSFALCSSMSGLGLDDSDSSCLGGF